MSILRSIRRAEAAAARRPPGDRAGKAPGAKALEGAGWRAWLKTLGPGTFTGEFADFHAGLWSWYWPVRHRLLRGEALRPDEMAALLIWSRGAGKPSHVEWCCIAEGALCGSGYVGYV